jgi:hypothetical protein
MLRAGADETLLQNAMIPMFPITINGNHLDQSTKPAADASKTNYILVQSRARLSPSQRQDFAKAGLELLDYVSKNTYLCGFQDTDLARVREMESIVYVDVYRTEFKVTSDLRETPMSLDDNIKVNVIFHNSVKSDFEILRAHIVEKSVLATKIFSSIHIKPNSPSWVRVWTIW